MYAKVKKIDTHREKQDRQIFIHSASQRELLTPESLTQQFVQRSRRNEARAKIFTDSTSKSQFCNKQNNTKLCIVLSVEGRVKRFL